MPQIHFNYCVPSLVLVTEGIYPYLPESQSI